MKYASTAISFLLWLMQTNSVIVEATNANVNGNGNANGNKDSTQGTCSNDDSNGNDNCHQPPPISYRETCQYYLAPSSIPNAGFGIYTTKAIPPDTPLTQIADAPSIILTDVELHNKNSQGEGTDTEIIWNHDNYFWDGTGQGEFEAKVVEESVMTFGAVCNYHTYLKNVKPSSCEYDDGITSRASKSPGMGAYSYQMGYLFSSTRGIEAGEEIFCDYGEEWLDGREYLSDVAREEEYITAAEIVQKTLLGLKGEEDVSDAVFRTVKSVVHHLDPRVSSVLPDNQEDYSGLERIVAEGTRTGTSMDSDSEALASESESESETLDSDIDRHSHLWLRQSISDSEVESESESEAESNEAIEMELAKKTLTARSLTWIQSNGKCLDNLIPQRSTLPHAGRGAFAQRFIPKGASIVPLPLLQIMDYTILDVFDYGVDEDGDPRRHRIVHGDDDDDDYEDDDDDDNEDDEEVPRGSQLVVNYCLSHPETTMYMCPQTNGILMNHCSNRTDTDQFNAYGGDCDKYNSNPDPNHQGANAELVWGMDWDPDTEDWLKMTVTEIEVEVKKGRRGLSFDVIAKRDIYPGDEVFIDYGLGWEKEWKEHVETFIPPPIGDYIPIAELNQQTEKLRTATELVEEPYPSNAGLTCIYWVADDNEAVDDNSPLDEDEVDWEDGDGSIYVEESESYKMYGYFFKCQVLERNERDNTYTVEIFGNANIERTIWGETGKRRILHDYPRKSFKFVNERYSSDQHIIGAFRSYIRIPDEIFPEQWKDVELID